MLLIPPVIGMILGGWTWAYIPTFIAWWMGYLSFWAWGVWARTRSPRRKALAFIPLAAYSSFTVFVGLITLISIPTLLTWAPVFLPLITIAGWQQWRGRERSLLSGVSTTLAASAMTAVFYSISLRHNASAWSLASPWGFLHPSASTTANNAESLHGWAWVWLVTALVTAYFVGTVPYVKSMIRGRGDRPLMVGSSIFHVLVACAVWIAAGMSWVSWWCAVVFTVVALRAVALPLMQAVRLRDHRPVIRPRMIGFSEVALSLLVLLVLVSG